MNDYVIGISILGMAMLATAILPQWFKPLPVSMPILLVGAGAALPWLWPGSPRVDPMENGTFTEHLAELAVIISLLSAGLKLDRPFGWQRWRSTWGLLAITMPLCIAALALGGVFVLGLPLAGAILLGAVAAPTDPVLASEVQVGPPGEGHEREVRFALTSEAGLNDGLAFPFVNLAGVVAVTGLAMGGLTQWLAVDVIWKVVAGVTAGAAVGHVIAMITFRYAKPNAVSDGLMAMALTLVAYGGTELIHGYGFIGVFVAAMMFRRYEANHEYHKHVHDFAEQIEQHLMVALLLLFGMAISHGLFAALTWPGALLALAFLLLIRPAAGVLGLVRTKAHYGERLVIATLGIRGIGTFYYLAYGLNAGGFDGHHADMLWAVAGFIVLLSIVLHGTVTPMLMRRNA